MERPLEELHDRLLFDILGVLEAAEDAFVLGALDDLIKPWARDELLAYQEESAAQARRHDRAMLLGRIADHGSSYVTLRRQLFIDLHHRGPEPVWRTAGTTRPPNFAVRATSQVFRSQPSYVLRRAAPGRPYQWDFTIVDEHSTSGFPVLTTPKRDPQENVHVEAPGLYSQSSIAYEQLDQGLRALGFIPYLDN